MHGIGVRWWVGGFVGVGIGVHGDVDDVPCSILLPSSFNLLAWSMVAYPGGRTREPGPANHTNDDTSHGVCMVAC